MSLYAIGSPRGCSSHPNSPDYDGRPGDYVQHLIDDGDDLLDRMPRDLCSVLSTAPAEHDSAIADLLRCLWHPPMRQNVRLRKLAEWLRAEPDMQEIAAECMASIAEQYQPDYSHED